MANRCTSPTSLYLMFLLFMPFLMSLRTSQALEQNVTNLQFYMHDIVGGPNRTAVRVAPTQPLNISDTNPIANMFGSIFVMDNRLTATFDPNSTLVGRAQGMYTLTSLGADLNLLMTLTYTFVSGPYNGSSFSVVGSNPVLSVVREMPIVGGTGIFRLARGYCLAQTYSMAGFDAIIGYNVTVLHN